MAKELMRQDLGGFSMDFVMQGMMMMMMAFFVLPMLPVVQSAQRYYESQYYEGQTDTKTLNATHKSEHIVLSTPWIGAYFINDGPNEVEIRINGADSPPFTMNPGETVTINRAGARDRIYAIYHYCHPGETATVRVIGEW